jgi:hypothetical protein
MKGAEMENGQGLSYCKLMGGVGVLRFFSHESTKTRNCTEYFLWVLVARERG